MIELGNVCNLHCKMCAREFCFGREMNVGFMPLERVKAIVDEVYPYLDSIGLTGLGETFMYPHLLEVVQYIRAKKPSIVITVSTNAHFPGFLNKIMPVLPYLDNVQFSVDGIGEKYEIIRPGTDFAFIRDNIQKVVQSAPDVTFMINSVVQPDNYDDLCNVIAFAHEMGIPYVNFNGINFAADPDVDVTVYDYFRSDEYRQLTECISRMAEQYPDVSVEQFRPADRPSFRNCPFPWHHQYITWDGYLVPCCAKPFPKELHFGNVFEQGVMAVINGEEMQRFRKLWQTDKAPAFCQQCNTLYC